jgi:ABC-type xylose transport system permease subunit
MIRSLPPRLRAPLAVLIVGVVALSIGGAAHGWLTVLYVAPIFIVAAVGYYIWAGRDTDTASLIRREPDERQADLRLKVQALIGRTLSLAVAVAYLVAASVHARLWPFAALVAVPLVVGVIGWAIYREHDGGRPSRAARN